MPETGHVAQQQSPCEHDTWNCQENKKERKVEKITVIYH